jgi:hypothetical protein
MYAITPSPNDASACDSSHSDVGQSNSLELIQWVHLCAQANRPTLALHANFFARRTSEAMIHI